MTTTPPARKRMAENAAQSAPVVLDGPSFGDYWTPDTEPVVTPLPSEAVDERRALGTLLAGVVDGDVDQVADAVLAAGYRLVAEDDEPARLRIENGWLMREVDACNCNGGGIEVGGAHEPYCGLVPELHFSTLPGWPSAEDDEDTVRVKCGYVYPDGTRCSLDRGTHDDVPGLADLHRSES